MKHINLLAIGFSLIAIGAFAVGGIEGEEAIGIAINCGLIGINYVMWLFK